MEQSRRLQNDAGTENACGAHESGAQAGDNGCTLSTTIEDHQLMPDQRGFGDDGTDPARPRQSGQGDEHMNE